MQYRVEGIVIRSVDYGEANKIVTLLTNTHGKIGVVIRGAKKPRSRHGSLGQLFTHGDYSFYRKGEGLGTLNHGEVLEANQRLREQLDMTAYASYAVELADRATQDNEASGAMFNQLNACLQAIQAGKDPQVTAHLFEMKVLELAGYAPELEQCLSCGGGEGPFVLSWRSGGVLCRRCRQGDPEHLAVPESVLKLLRLFRGMDMRRLGNVQVSPDTKRALREAMRRLTDAHLGLQLKSRAFLEQLDRYGLANLADGSGVDNSRH
ncbi:DNA repair protein RecO [Paenibacillus sp. IB182496]|uniref:DNA repair protein RecO n=1 Tax=Paenibacillus sabuli TaxID=2772509 RepID=A0A927GQJ5_9BACL|nr:DNA repair protein RecO [Paenibacillus sabuli]MBD2844443.1 DNA repair protein RecO [Paenibacillus sabuli]